MKPPRTWAAQVGALALVVVGTGIAECSRAAAAGTPQTIAVVIAPNGTLVVADIAGTTPTGAPAQDSVLAIAEQRDKVSVLMQGSVPFTLGSPQCSFPDPALKTKALCRGLAATARYELWLGPGNDNASVDHPSGPVQIVGGYGDDTVKVLGAQTSTVWGDNQTQDIFRDGDDDLYGGPQPDAIYGGGGNDRIAGGRGADTVSGGFGDDLLFGGDGRDHLVGGLGHDALVGGGGVDVMDSLDNNGPDSVDCRGDDGLRDTLYWERPTADGRQIDHLIGCTRAESGL